MDDPFSKGLQTGFSFVDQMRAHRAMQLEEKKHALDEKKHGLAEKQYGVSERAVGVQEDQLALKEQTEEARWNKSLSAKPVRAAAFFTGLSKNMPQVGPVIKPLLEKIDNQEIKTRGELRTELMQMHAGGQFTPVREKLREDAAKLIAKGENQKAAALMQMYEATSKDGFEDFLDHTFGKPMSLRRSAGERGVGRGEMKPYRMPDGTVIYRGSKEEPPPGAIPFSKPKTSYEWTVETTPEGGTRIRRGPPTTGSTTEVEKRMIGFSEEIARVEGVLDRFDPEFVTAKGKAKGWWLNFKNLVGIGAPLTEDQEQFIVDQSQMVSDATKNVNLLLRDMSGVAINPEEIKRNMLVEPNTGKTWFTGDGPVRFKAKAMARLQSAKMASERYLEYRHQGIDAVVARQKATRDFRRFVSEESKRGRTGGTEPPAALPKHGHIEDGMRYIGKSNSKPDAANPSNWEKVK